MNKPYIISISALSGGGKTTVTNELASNLKNTAVVSFDSYPIYQLKYYSSAKAASLFNIHLKRSQGTNEY